MGEKKTICWFVLDLKIGILGKVRTFYGGVPEYYMNFPEAKIGLIFSILLHLGLFSWAFWISSESSPEIIRILPKQGSQVSIFARNQTRGRGESPTDQYTEKSLGASEVEEEINRLRKKILYPPSALERGLESECEWIVTVAENHKFKKLEEVQSCKYAIFDRAFRDALQDWEFNLPPGTKIRIPVSFRIEDK
jgi:TonB family protein